MRACNVLLFDYLCDRLSSKSSFNTFKHHYMRKIYTVLASAAAIMLTAVGLPDRMHAATLEGGYL